MQRYRKHGKNIKYVMLFTWINHMQSESQNWNLDQKIEIGLLMNAGCTRAALMLGGTILGYYPVRVLPSKTPIFFLLTLSFFLE
uniref:Uncharacterized protein n=1 Tax=Triticum urartu TaxID=4572 RepID=A0A8R7U6P5_TRIUA